MTTSKGRLDAIERSVRLVAGIGLLLLAWGYSFGGVDGIGAIALGTIALATALAGACPVESALARFDS
jgi:hypothetical protein